MAETARFKIDKVSENTLGVNSVRAAASVRVAPNNYFAAFFLNIFFVAFAVYLEQDTVAAALGIFGSVILPLLVWNDRVVFDGEKIFRAGTAPRVWQWLNGEKAFLKLADVEQVETEATRILKREGTIFYRYKTILRGKNKCFVLASGGADYRQMIAALFPRICGDALDNRSLELRDYLGDPKKILQKAETLKIPSAEVLENSFEDFRIGGKPPRRAIQKADTEFEEIEKADELRRFANELRMTGNLRQSLEAFRRLLLSRPADGWLIFEFARCLHSYAGAERDEKLQKKARAALRLAEIRAGGDGELLARLGESYFQYGDWTRAGKVFQKSYDAAAKNFRAVRGLAEIALREGKIAHVIHHFTRAAEIAGDKVLKKWAQDEVKYFSTLNDDESYLDAEVKRLARLENIERGKKVALRLAVFGFVTIFTGIFTDNLIATIGWTCAGVALLFWTGLLMSHSILAERSSILSDKN